MADNERDVERRISTLEAGMSSLISEFKDFKEEMRQQNQMRAAEMQELRQKSDADLKEIRSSIDSMGKHVRNLAITSMAAIGGMAIAVGAMVVTVIYSVSNK